jgi:hypothetical protein
MKGMLDQQALFDQVLLIDKIWGLDKVDSKGRAIDGSWVTNNGVNFVLCLLCLFLLKNDMHA